MATDAGEVTQLLRAMQGGDENAAPQLVPLVYKELRRLAAHYMRQEREGHTLQPTALVHEAYLRLADQQHMTWQSRAHFLGIAAQSMRRILIDHARGRVRVKRGGERERVDLDEERVFLGERSPEQSGKLLALDEALDRLAEIDPRQGRIVELRYFGGLTVEETAEVLGISPKTVKRDWSVAKAWLHAELQQ